MDIKNLVTEDDTEELDAEISALRDAIAERNLFSNSETEELEALIAKSMVLGELYERKKWQEAQAQAVPEGFILVPKESLKVAISWMDEDIDPWQMGADSFAELYEHKPILEKAMIEAAEKEMGEAQEQSHD